MQYRVVPSWVVFVVVTGSALSAHAALPGVQVQAQSGRALALASQRPVYSGSRLHEVLGLGVTCRPGLGTSDADARAEVDVGMPLTSTYELTDAVALYETRSIGLRFGPGREREPRPVVWGATGLRLGREAGVRLEVGYTFDIESRVTRFIVGAAWFD